MPLFCFRSASSTPPIVHVHHLPVHSAPSVSEHHPVTRGSCYTPSSSSSRHLSSPPCPSSSPSCSTHRHPLTPRQPSHPPPATPRAASVPLSSYACTATSSCRPTLPLRVLTP